MSDDAALILRLEARTRKFEKDLGKAIDRLDGNVKRGNRSWDKGMGKMERRAKKFSKNVGDTFKGVLKATTGLASIGVGATLIGGAVAIRDTLNYANEIDNLSKLAGVSAERFQELSFASDKYGISQEKIADVLKDTNDKFGDFFATGAGPLVDFFDQVAPKIGLTEEAFRGLSSDQALGLYVSSLEKAGANQQDLSFYMEALASDATALLPLFKGNGKELDDFSQRARDLGVVMDNDLVGKGASAKKKFDELGASIRGEVQSAVIELAPTIEELTDDFIELLPRLAEWGTALVKGLNSTGERLEWLGKQWNASPFGDGNIQADPRTFDEAKKRLRDILDLARAAEKVQENNGGFKDTFTRSREEKIQKALAISFFGKEEYDQIKNESAFLEDAIAAEYHRILDLVNELKPIEGPDVIIPEEPVVEPSGGLTPRDTGIQRDHSAEGRADEIRREIELIRELGKTEREQVQDLLQLRLAAIDESKEAEASRAELRSKAHEDASRELKKLAEDEAAAASKLAEDRFAARREEFDLSQDKLGFLAEIEAAQARMAGRSLEAAQIELEATRKRYEAELEYIDQLIAKDGERADLLAQRADAQAGLASTDANIQETNEHATAQFDALTSDDDSLEAELERIDQNETAKLQRLEELRTEELEALRDFEAEKTRIEAEAEAARTEAQLASYQNKLNFAQDSLSQISSALKTAGLEDTKAAKIAAKAQQVVALGSAVVSTAQGVSKSLALGPPGIPMAIAIGALGAIQVAAIASQTFDGGGFTGNGTRSGGVDGKGGYYAVVHPNETIVDHTKPGREVNGKSIEEAFGLSGSSLGRGVNSSSVSGRGSSGGSFRGGDFVVQGNVDKDVLPELQEKMDRFLQNQEQSFNKMADARDRRTTPRTDRRVGRGTGR